MNKLFFSSLLLILPLCARAEDATTSMRIGTELLQLRDWPGAAVEFRRAALLSDDPTTQARNLWLAGWSYAQTQDWTRAMAMLDQIKNGPTELEDARLLLHGDILTALGRTNEADFDFSGVAFRSHHSDARRYANAALARHALEEGQMADARNYAAELGPEHPGRQAIEDYLNGSDKSPALGGWLGIFPGMGYFYSGEIANGVRNLLLNGLFIWGMTETAKDGRWAAFSALTFFEITWYTGSIYGGIDAAHRYNHERLHRTLDALDGRATLDPDVSLMPEFGIRFRF